MPWPGKTNRTPEKLLISGPGHILLADYLASTQKITILLDQNVTGLPSWTAFVPPSLLYAVDEDSSTTRTFNVDLSANTITPGIQAQGSSGVVHLLFNWDQTRMVGAAYGSGKVDIWNTEKGGLTLIKTLISNDTLGPNQVSAHPHESVLDPTGRFFVVNDLGTDHLLVIDSQDDKWDFVNHVQVTPAGAGPRHGAFYPAGTARATHYLVACELKSLINVYELQYTGSSINFSLIQSVSTYGPHNPPADPSTAAAAELVLNGDDVYVSNRLTGNATDSIAHFKIVKDSPTAPGSSGRVTGVAFQDTVSSGGILPRMFSISTDKQNLFVGNQAGEEGIVVLGIGKAGKLEPAKASVANTVFGTQPTTGPEFVKQIA